MGIATLHVYHQWGNDKLQKVEWIHLMVNALILNLQTLTWKYIVGFMGVAKIRYNISMTTVTIYNFSWLNIRLFSFLVSIVYSLIVAEQSWNVVLVECTNENTLLSFVIQRTMITELSLWYIKENYCSDI